MAGLWGTVTDLAGSVRGAIAWPVGFFDSDPRPAGTGAVSGGPNAPAPAAWRGRLQKGSFRGVPFYIDEAGLEGGRRWQHFEYPLRDLPFNEDLGRAIRRYALRVYVIGDEYMGARDRMIAACEAPGPAKLVHPYLGQLTVALDGYRLRESDDEGGIAYFDLAISESSETAAPDPIQAPGAAMQAASGGVLGGAASSFSSAWKAAGAGLPDWVSVGALKEIGGFAGELGLMGANKGQLGKLMNGLPADLSAGSVSGFVRQGIGMVAGEDVVTKYAGYGRKALTYLDKLGTMKLSSSAPAAPAPPAPHRGRAAEAVPALGAALTPAQAQLAANTAALERLINQTAVAYLAAPIAVIPLASYAELAGLRANVLELFDSVAVAATAEVSRPLALFRATIIRQLARRGATLRPLREYVTMRPTASRVLAHRLYQDPERAPELVARVHAVHPGFLPLTGVVAAI